MIRELKERDMVPCYEIVKENWGIEAADRFWDEVRHIFVYDMKWPPVYYVYEKAGEVVAFAGMMESWQMHKVMDFIWINVKKEFQGNGIGAALTKHRIWECRKRDIRVINLITKHPNFFEQFKFVMSYVYDGGWFGMTLQLGPLTL